MDSPCQLAELDQRGLDVVLCAREEIRCRRVGASRVEAERDGKGHEALLRSVVEVAFDPAPLGVGSGDDPAARRAHLCELSTHLGRQPLVLEHEPGGGPDRFHQGRLVEQGRIVNERGDLHAAGGHRGYRPVRSVGQ